MTTKNNQQPSKNQPEFIRKLIHAKQGMIFRGVIGLVLGYAFLSRAFDTGSWIQYFVALLFTILGIRILRRSFTIQNDKQVKARKTR